MKIEMPRPERLCPRCDKDALYFDVQDEDIVGVKCENCGYFETRK